MEVLLRGKKDRISIPIKKRVTSLPTPATVCVYACVCNCESVVVQQPK